MCAEWGPKAKKVDPGTASHYSRFLYTELMKFDPSAPEDSIFQPLEDGKLKIKDDITFHLYIR